MKKWSILAVLAAMLCTLLAAGCGGGPQQNAASDGKNKLVIYTSMKGLRRSIPTSRSTISRRVRAS